VRNFLLLHAWLGGRISVDLEKLDTETRAWSLNTDEHSSYVVLLSCNSTIQPVEPRSHAPQSPLLRLAANLPPPTSAA
jgi:hypothetical protein